MSHPQLIKECQQEVLEMGKNKWENKWEIKKVSSLGDHKGK